MKGCEAKLLKEDIIYLIEEKVVEISLRTVWREIKKTLTFWEENGKSNANGISKKRHGNLKKRYNCARAYKGYYIGGGTNEFEQSVFCDYKVLQGNITVKRLKPLKIHGTNSEGTLFKLETFIIYPKTYTAVISITNINGTFPLKLHKVKKGLHFNMFKVRL